MIVSITLDDKVDGLERASNLMRFEENASIVEHVISRLNYEIGMAQDAKDDKTIQYNAGKLEGLRTALTIFMYCSSASLSVDMSQRATQ